MRKFLLSFAALSLALGASAASKRLASVTEMSYGDEEKAVYSYDETGRLVSVESKYDLLTIDYSQVAAKKLVITEQDKYDKSVYTYEMTLNDEGLVVRGVECENGVPDDDYVLFEYTDGRLTNFKQVDPDEVEETRITYDADGLVAKVENIDGNSVSENETITFEYGDIPNTGSLQLWDELFSVDLDTFALAATAGFMGKAPAQLPVKAIETDVYGTDTEVFEWEVSEDGYVTKLTIPNEWGGSEVYAFAWEIDDSGVAGIVTDKDGITRYYDLNGVEVSSDTKGIVIERKADGTVTKRINAQ